MNVKELIQALEDYHEVHGNAPVQIVAEMGDFAFVVNDVTPDTGEDEEGDEFFVVAGMVEEVRKFSDGDEDDDDEDDDIDPEDEDDEEG